MKIRQNKHTHIYITIGVLMALAIVGGLFFYNKTSTQKPTRETAVKSRETTKIKTNEFDKTTHSIDEPGSIWWIVGKKRPLPDNYVPPSLVTPNVTANDKKSAAENTLRPETASALEKLFANAKQAGFDFMLASGYRSSQLQSVYYNSLVSANGQAEADRLSAKPGTSEHQTGLSLDVARADRKLYLEQTFGADSSGRWLADNAHEYGFIIRYPQGKEAFTGYDYEPWHIRFVGTDLANELYSKQQTMEEFFGL